MVYIMNGQNVNKAYSIDLSSCMWKEEKSLLDRFWLWLTSHFSFMEALLWILK